MADVNCSACADLRENAPDFVENGVTESVCTSLKNDTGLNPNLSVAHTDCEDLDTANDCLIGNLEGELPAYEICDWKEFMHHLIPNIYNVIKAMICSICGLWENVHTLWCYIENLMKTSSATLYAYERDSSGEPITSKPINGFRIASGVKVRTPWSNVNNIPLRVSMIGQVMYMTGSLEFSGNMPVSYTNGETVAWTDFYNGGTAITNEAGNKSANGNAPSGGLFVYSYTVKKCDFGFSDFFVFNLFGADAGDLRFRCRCYEKGDSYPYDYGYGEDNSTRTVDIDDDELLIEVRLTYAGTWGIAKNTGNITPNGITGVRRCETSFNC